MTIFAAEMKKTLSLIILSVIVALTVSAQVRPGIEVLEAGGFEQLKGKRVGLITNPTGVDSRLNATVDILANAPEVELTALFAPEHGIRGDVVAGQRVSQTTDPATGLPVYSIYGRVKSPTAEMLRNVDALVYDIQDNGCRSFTFISTMGLSMEAAAKAGKEFIVLDRPNPLGGNRVEGPLTEQDCISFVSRYAIPYIYGLTPGELAMFLKGEKLIEGADSLKLTVVPMEGWTRDMTYRQTGLPWILPSPHIPSAETCLYYPASGILGELDAVSIGVGYTMPFRTFAAPEIDAPELSRRLNALGLDGIRFRPIYYTPFYGKFKGRNIAGVQVDINPDTTTPLTLVQFYFMQEMHAMDPSFKPLAAVEGKAANLSMFDKVTGSKSVRREFSKAYKVNDIIEFWNKDSEPFTTAKQIYHLYR